MKFKSFSKDFVPELNYTPKNNNGNWDYYYIKLSAPYLAAYEGHYGGIAITTVQYVKYDKEHFKNYQTEPQDGWVDFNTRLEFKDGVILFLSSAPLEIDLEI